MTLVRLCPLRATSRWTSAYSSSSNDEEEEWERWWPSWRFALPPTPLSVSCGTGESSGGQRVYPNRLVGELYVKGDGALLLLPCPPPPIPLRLKVLEPPHVPDDEAKNAPLPTAAPPRLLPRRPGLLLPPPLWALEEEEEAMLLVVGGA